MDVDLLWKRKGRSEIHTDALHSIIMTSVILGDYVYGLDSYGAIAASICRTGTVFGKTRLWWTKVDGPRPSSCRMGSRPGCLPKRELVIGSLSPSGFKSLSKTKLIDPTTFLPRREATTFFGRIQPMRTSTYSFAMTST